jgi:cobalt-precorrin 5A hydrolase
VNARTGLAAIAVTRRGAALARTLREALPGCRSIVPRRFAEDGDTAHDGAAEAIAAEFARADGMILVMAAGIAVRLIAPLLSDKQSDPAVVVVDETGRFAISLLSGHLGGANALAEQIAAAIGTQPVITTASEAAGVPAPDMLAQQQGWRVAAASDLTAVAAALVNGDPVGVVQECGVEGWLPDPLPPHISRYESLEELVWLRPTAALIVSDRDALPIVPSCPYVLYRPRTLTLGVGSSSDAPIDELAALARQALTTGRYASESVAVVATIDRKRHEPAITTLAQTFGLPLVTFTANALDAAPGPWTRSTVVRAAVGVGGVAEPAALLAAGEGATLTVMKLKSAHATAALARCPRGHEVER